MAASRDAGGRFASKPLEQLSPAYRARIERARAQGRSLSEARGHTATPRPVWQSSQVVANPTYRKALDVLARTRDGLSLTKAAKEVGIAPDTVLRYAGSAFTQDSQGRWTPKPSDRLVRQSRQKQKCCFQRGKR